MTRQSLRSLTAVVVVTLTAWAVPASAQTVGAASSFAIVGGTTVTAGGATSVVNGDVGVSPGTSITGFPSPASTTPPYSVHSNDGAAINAQAATLALYNSLAATGGATPILAQLSGTTRTPGVYSIPAGADLAGLGTFTLDGAGIYVFQVASSLTANVGSQVVLINGANACNVFWQVTSAATLNGVTFAGNVVAQANVTLGVGDSLTGRALATSLGSVTLSGGNSISGCSTAAVAPTPTPAPAPTVNVCARTAPDLFIVKTHAGSFAVGTNANYSIALGNNGVTSVGPIVVTDTLPPTVTFVSAAGPGWTCAVAGQVVTCTTPSALPGIITLIVNPSIDAVPAVTNNATVAGGGDCDTTNNATSDRAVVAVAVPTLPEWAFVALALLLVTSGVVMMRRRRSTTTL